MWQSLKKIYEDISSLLQNSVFSIVFAVVFVICLCCLVSFPASNPLTLQWHELWTFLLYFQLHAANQKKTKNINIWHFQKQQNTSMLMDGYDIYVWLIYLPYPISKHLMYRYIIFSKATFKFYLECKTANNIPLISNDN